MIRREQQAAEVQRRKQEEEARQLLQQQELEEQRLQQQRLDTFQHLQGQKKAFTVPTLSATAPAAERKVHPMVRKKHASLYRI
jgi:hypothetical protein